MNENEHEQFEAELRKFPPARLPEQFMARILAAKPCVQSFPEAKPRQLAGWPDLLGVLRWLAPVTAAAVIALVIWRRESPAGPAPAPVGAPKIASIRADGVQVDQKLVSSYDAVAELPSGEPVPVPSGEMAGSRRVERQGPRVGGPAKQPAVGSRPHPVRNLLILISRYKMKSITFHSGAALFAAATLFLARPAAAAFDDVDDPVKSMTVRADNDEFQKERENEHKVLVRSVERTHGVKKEVAWLGVAVMETSDDLQAQLGLKAR